MEPYSEKIHDPNPLQMAEENGEVNAMEMFAKHMAPILKAFLENERKELQEKEAELSNAMEQLGPNFRVRKRKIYWGPIIWTVCSGIAVTSMILIIIYVNKHPL